jgi:hypothetical protein
VLGIGHGIGYRFYGQREFRLDHSYLTTQFFCILYFPVFPIRTMRIIPDRRNTWLPFGKFRYVLVSKQPPYFPQVFAVYQCATAIVALGIVFPIYIEPAVNSRFPVLKGGLIEPCIFFLWIAIPWLAALWLRSHARRRLHEYRRDPNDPTPIS